MGEIVVVKCGGSTISNLSDSFFESIKALKENEQIPIIVHGGGPEINQMLTTLHVESEFIDGLRKTTGEVLDVAEMVLCGKVNKHLVHKLQVAGLNSIGLSGCDGQLLKATPINKEKLGLVGDVESVNVSFLTLMIDNDYVPIIAPIGLGENGDRYNINADSVAGSVADAIGAQQLLFVTDVDGILNKEGKLIEKLTTEDVESLILDGTIYGGMIPKVKAALKSLQGKIQEVVIINGKGTTLFENGELVGTKIVKVSELTPLNQ
ncbi:acetylglutamate kinase [Anaerobacillus sp. MEB173]|uniref:acetylglutamate kinase n=1 Tax=Anaerobacillus sp. MEB173 TaxID=3383345 RepID=UPI003F90393F